MKINAWIRSVEAPEPVEGQEEEATEVTYHCVARGAEGRAQQFPVRGPKGEFNAGDRITVTVAAAK